MTCWSFLFSSFASLFTISTFLTWHCKHFLLSIFFPFSSSSHSLVRSVRAAPHNSLCVVRVHIRSTDRLAVNLPVLAIYTPHFIHINNNVFNKIIVEKRNAAAHEPKHDRRKTTTTTTTTTNEETENWNNKREEESKIIVCVGGKAKHTKNKKKT